MNAITSDKAIESEPKSSVGQVPDTCVTDRVREEHKALLELPFVVQAPDGDLLFWRPAAVPKTHSGVEIATVAASYAKALVNHLRGFAAEIHVEEAMVSIAQSMFEPGRELREMEIEFWAAIGREIAASRPRTAGPGASKNPAPDPVLALDQQRAQLERVYHSMSDSEEERAAIDERVLQAEYRVLNQPASTLGGVISRLQLIAQRTEPQRGRLDWDHVGIQRSIEDLERLKAVNAAA